MGKVVACLFNDATMSRVPSDASVGPT